jgi:plasmid stabilization system protein ParE
MPHLIWSAPAVEDLERLNRFLHEKSLSAASRAMQAIYDGVQTLTLFPDAGRPAERYGPGRREWVIDFGEGGYVVLYRRRGEQVLIAALRSGREDDYPRFLP